MRQATASLRLNWFANTQNGPAWPSNAWRTISASKKSRLASCASAIWADPKLADINRKEIVIEVRMIVSFCFLTAGARRLRLRIKAMTKVHVPAGMSPAGTEHARTTQSSGSTFTSRWSWLLPTQNVTGVVELSTNTVRILVSEGIRYCTDLPVLGSCRTTRSVLIVEAQSSPFLSKLAR